MKIEKPPILTHDEAQSYIDQHYAELMKETTRTGVYPARWHREAQRDADAAYYEPLIRQAKAKEREKMLNEIQADSVSVANLIEKARVEVAMWQAKV